MKERKREQYIALGMVFGMLGGVIFDNIALGLCFGLMGGVLMSAQKKKSDDQEDEPED